MKNEELIKFLMGLPNDAEIILICGDPHCDSKRGTVEGYNWVAQSNTIELQADY